MVLPSVSITNHSRSSTCSGDLMDYVEHISLVILAMLFAYYLCTLVVSRDILFLSKEVKRLKNEVHISEKPHALTSESEELAERRATLSTSTPRSCVCQSSNHPRDLEHPDGRTHGRIDFGLGACDASCVIITHKEAALASTSRFDYYQGRRSSGSSERSDRFAGKTRFGERKEPSACKDAKAQINDKCASARSLSSIF